MPHDSAADGDFASRYGLGLEQLASYRSSSLSFSISFWQASDRSSPACRRASILSGPAAMLRAASSSAWASNHSGSLHWNRLAIERATIDRNCQIVARQRKKSPGCRGFEISRLGRDQYLATTGPPKW